jgi:hypothetical protein
MGKQTGIKTYISHGSGKDLNDFLISQMKKQLKLDTSNQAFQFLECSMSEQAYNKILKEKKLI